ncbi:MAG: T9SS type A sorting domain-containing protein [Flavobacteriales bacterium]|jgi:hypothetical protein|nr:T9SS type A sorting domain-containing protein [Flavobacteriales bacterium]
MKRAILLFCLALFLCLTAHNAQAQTQAYPDSSASWCFDDFNNSYLVQVWISMGADPDTVILGQTYKRIEINASYNGQPPELVKYYYVRSDDTGKGYVLLLDSMQEYLAVDVGANAGDTVNDVLTIGTWGVDPYFEIQDIIVDSVRTYENNGVTVTRQFIHAENYPILDPGAAYFVFWQAGAGNSVGPVLQYTFADGFNQVICVRVQDTYVYSIQSGLPGVPCDCALSSVGVEEMPKVKSALISPNPSTGIFALSSPTESTTVYSPTGQELFQTTGSQIDLSAYPPGLYHAVVRTAQGVGHVRLMVLR